jgi:AraC-like DNA-binding protein
LPTNNFRLPLADKHFFLILFYDPSVRTCNTTFPMHPNEPLLQSGFLFSSALPAAYRGMILADSVPGVVRGAGGEWVLQRVDQPGFSLRFHSFNILQPMEFLAQQGSDLLVSFLALKNNLHYSIKGLGSLFLRPGQFALLHGPATGLTAAFARSQEYQHLEVAWSADLVRPLLEHFPSLQRTFSIASLHPGFVGTPGAAAGSSALHLVQEILRPPIRSALRSLYFDVKVREYLLLLLAASDQQATSPASLPRADQEKLLSLAERLQTDTAEKFPIAHLAQDTGMNEMKLKTAFKALFGKGIFEYHMEARMQEAHRLLEETDLTTKAIAARVGYDLTTSFITKFREYFGYAPSQVSKR